MDAPPTLGHAIRSRRLALGFTQEELAERIGDGVRQAEVSRLECDRVALPRRRRLMRIAAALDLSIGQLLASAGWAGADDAFRLQDEGATQPIPDEQARDIARNLGAPTVRPDLTGSSELRAAIQRSRELHERTVQLLETSTALAASWDAGITRRRRPQNS